MTFRSALYRGRLMHARRDEHAKRAFRYPVYMACLDLDELDVLDRELRLFSRGGRNVFAFHDDDYAATLSPSARHDEPTARHEEPLRASLAALHEGAGLVVPHTMRLVTNLRTFGYVFNPVSFFLGYDARGALATVVAEVNNTYGGRLRYLLGPRERMPDRRDRPGRVGFRHVRELFVSPFLHGEASYDFSFDAPLDGPRLAIGMRVSQPHAAGDHTTFVARLEGTRTALSDRTLALAALRYPMMSAQVIGLIHWQALKLRLGGVPYRRPRADHRPLR